MTGLMIW